MGNFKIKIFFQGDPILLLSENHHRLCTFRETSHHRDTCVKTTSSRFPPPTVSPLKDTYRSINRRLIKTSSRSPLPTVPSPYHTVESPIDCSPPFLRSSWAPRRSRRARPVPRPVGQRTPARSTVGLRGTVVYRFPIRLINFAHINIDPLLFLPSPFPE